MRNKKNNVIATSENKLVFSEGRNALCQRFREKSYNYVAFINDIIMIVLYLIHRSDSAWDKGINNNETQQSEVKWLRYSAAVMSVQ